MLPCDFPHYSYSTSFYSLFMQVYIHNLNTLYMNIYKCLYNSSAGDINSDVYSLVHSLSISAGCFERAAVHTGFPSSILFWESNSFNLRSGLRTEKNVLFVENFVVQDCSSNQKKLTKLHMDSTVQFHSRLSNKIFNILSLNHI